MTHRLLLMPIANTRTEKESGFLKKKKKIRHSNPPHMCMKEGVLEEVIPDWDSASTPPPPRKNSGKNENK